MSMVTRCPACGTGFRVSAEQLKAQRGSVRCGRCSTVFNAFDTLSPIFYKRPAGWGRWFQYFFLLYTLIIAIGIYGIATLAVIAFFILRDPIWRDNGDSLVQPAPVDMALSDNPGAQEKTVFQSSPSIAS